MKPSQEAGAADEQRVNKVQSKDTVAGAAAKTPKQRKEEKLEQRREHLSRVDPSSYVFVATDNAWYVKRPDGSLNEEKCSSTALKTQYVLEDDLWPLFVQATLRVHTTFPVYTGMLGEVVEVDGVSIYNTYQRASFLPKDICTWHKPAGNWDNIRAVFSNVCDGDDGALRYQLGWFARWLRALFIDNKPIMMRTALAYWGEEGSGKGTVSDIVETLVHSSNVMRMDQSRLESHFTDDVNKKVFCVANEVAASGDKSADKIKGWITDPDVIVEKKGKDAACKKHHMNIIFMGNRSRPVTLESDHQRRFNVFHCTKPLDKNVAKAVHDDIKGPRQELLAFAYHVLVEMPASDLVEPGQLFMNEAMKRLIQESKASQFAFIDALCQDGYDIIADKWEREEKARDEFNRRLTRHDRFVVKAVLYEVYQSWCRSSGVKAVGRKVFDPAFEEKMAALFGEERFYGSRLQRTGEPKHPVWTGIPLEPQLTAEELEKGGEGAKVIPMGNPYPSLAPFVGVRGAHDEPDTF